MTTIHHINCGTLVVPTYPTVVCHCLLLQDRQRLALVDTGIGLRDVRNPAERLGQPLIDMAGFRFHEPDTAVRRIEGLGLSPDDVRHVVLTHGDPDHAVASPTSRTPTSTSRRRNTLTSQAVTGGTSRRSSPTAPPGRPTVIRPAGGSGWRPAPSNSGSPPTCF